MRLHKLLDLGDFGTNCYILETCEKSAVIIDAPYSGGVIEEFTDSRGLSPKMIILTHGHCDHIESLNQLVKKYGCEVYISEEDLPMLTDSGLCRADYFGMPFQPFYGAKTFSDGETITLDDVSLRVLGTPGHTPGSVSFVSDGFIFTGDTLFAGSIGRTDLGGEYQTLMRSIAKLYSLGGNYIIYPGHSGQSDLYTELCDNPYLGMLRN